MSEFSDYGVLGSRDIQRGESLRNPRVLLLFWHCLHVIIINKLVLQRGRGRLCGAGNFAHYVKRVVPTLLLC